MRPRIPQFVFLCALVALVAASWSKEDYEIFQLRDELAAREGKDVTFYDYVGVSPSATFDEISKALKKKSRTLHPDKAKQSFIASRSTPRPKKPGKKSQKKPGVHVSKGPTDREIQRFVKRAEEDYRRLGVVANILKGPQRERYDFFLSHGFPTWRGTGYYYSRYRPGLGTVLVGLFFVGGGLAHYFVLVTSYKRQYEFMDRYIRYARKAAWGDESGIMGIPGVGSAVDVPPQVEEPDPMANLNRRQKRELERQKQKEKPSKTKPTKSALPNTTASGTGERRRVQAENGKILVVDSTGDVYLEEEDEDGNVQEYLLDLSELAKPTVWDTAVVRLPIWIYRKAADPFLKKTTQIPEVEIPKPRSEQSPQPVQNIVVPEKPVAVDHMSSSQISDSGFEIVDSTGIEKEIERGSDTPGVKKRGKKGKK